MEGSPQCRCIPVKPSVQVSSARFFVTLKCRSKNLWTRLETMSTATSRPEYADLMARALPSVIHSEKENERYLAMLEELDQKGKVSAAEDYPATAGVSLFSWRSRKPASCSRLMDAKSASHIQTRFIFRKRPSRNSI